MQFIAEIGSAHAGSLSQAKEHIIAAKESGATTAKFQWIIADEIVSDTVGDMHFGNTTFNLHHTFKQVEKDIEFYQQLKEYTENLDLQFLCSVFGIQSLHQYLQLEPSIIKIASPEINHIPLLQEISKNNASILLSTGLATLIDIQICLDILIQKNTTIEHNNRHNSTPHTVQLLHCVTAYPANYNEYNLSLLHTYQQFFTDTVGISDHSNSIALLAATSLLFGSSIIEKHFCITKTTHNIDNTVALSPQQFSTMVQACKQIETLLNNTSNSIDTSHSSITQDIVLFLRDIAEQEHHQFDVQSLLKATDWQSPALLDIYYSSRRSVFSKQHSKKPSSISLDDIVILRSEKNIQPGIPAEYLQYID